MKILRYLTLLLCLIALHSCSEPFEIIVESNLGITSCRIQGTITDQDGTALERIKVSVYSNQDERSSSYTSSDGRFLCEFDIQSNIKEAVLDIMIEDIDGKERGGLFETKTTVVTLYESDLHKSPLIVNLPTFRLSHATASENNPQS